MDNPLNHTEEDEINPHDQDGLPNGEHPAPINGVITTVDPLRPYAYRLPTGHPEEDDTAHPLRRRTDPHPYPDPQR